ncbi:hypothetical protein [Streptomyces sp. HUAS TT7]|uniref:hypothetical protein n=1 Tax=Streptomyces sp. HUAS TT7 TaxID=3447507 RepID=UPI003F65508E
MFFAVIGTIFLVAGLLFATDTARAAERAFHAYAQLTPRVGTATPRTLRIVCRPPGGRPTALAEL